MVGNRRGQLDRGREMVVDEGLLIISPLINRDDFSG